MLRVSVRNTLSLKQIKNNNEYMYHKPVIIEL